MTIPTPESQLKFLTNLQRVLDEGVFVATYKFALIISLADYCVENGNDSGDSIFLSAGDIAGNFIEYYWRQAVPYANGKNGSSASVLKQSTGNTPVIIRRIMKFREQVGGSLLAARKDTQAWQALTGRVATTIAQMPLWKLQVVGHSVVPFLYEQYGTGRAINLFPGVVYCFRKFYDLIRSLVQAAWIRHIRSLNVDLLGESDLAEFLFGSERSVYPDLRVILKEVQSGYCFYCRVKLRESGEIDHFIPWSRYPLDLGHNFVLAHSSCNRSKRDFLAAPHHLENWKKRNQIHGNALGQEFDGKGILHNLEATDRITFWAYSQAETAGASLWLQKNELHPIDPSWRYFFTA